MNEVTLMQAALSDEPGPLTDAEGNARRAELDRLMEENQRRLRDTMGESDYAKFDSIQRAEPYRESIGQITNAMRSRGIEVDSELEELILTGYTDAVRSVAERASGSTDAPMPDSQKADQRRQQQQALQVELMRKFTGLLSEPQIHGFLESYIEQQGEAR